ncbi:hypothetical protein [Subtercola endophyticus]|uniref:hypothetical protein n=1 Tax=Subtercola endophyticus TaxID=2895559 RepID=UPI001E61A80B|nr:hypothetical protein [Subtercola endophyticus]UFS58994.1 hypothetical protein LQ955_18705 [Subtercola endophyticus]
MIVDWPAEFGRQLDRYEADAAGGNSRARVMLEKLTFELTLLEELEGEPLRDTATIKRVAQSKQYSVRRVSHPFAAGVAVRLICWFPPNTGTVGVALFSGDKANMGDVFYDSVGTRADALIETWMRETGEK